MMKYFAFTFVFLQAKVQAVNHIVNGWSPQGGPYPSIDAAAGDTITFVWTGNHNVHRLSVDNCVTTSQNLITSISNTPIPINAVDAGSTFFFACGVGNHCESGQKGQVVVRVTPPTQTSKPSGHPTAQPTRHPTRDPVAQQTVPPTLKPTPSPKCSDDVTWFQANRPANNCLKVSALPQTRCAWVSSGNIPATQACPVACSKCPPSGATTPSPSPKPSKSASCANSATWYQVGKPANTCSKVTTASRCAWVSSTGITAKVACPLACGTCA